MGGFSRAEKWRDSKIQKHTSPSISRPNSAKQHHLKTTLVRSLKLPAGVHVMCEFTFANECSLNTHWPCKADQKEITGKQCSEPEAGSSSWHSLFSTFIRLDSMKATFSLCSVYSWRRSSLAASNLRGFLEAWTRRLGLTERLCSATEDVNLWAKQMWFRLLSPYLVGLESGTIHLGQFLPPDFIPLLLPRYSVTSWR